jgi:23S rRNA-/tRNA-specific pseudouridylate synthase
MTVVAGRGVPRPTLLDVVEAELGVARPVHRLDKPTTGCCIVALSAFGQQALSDAFRRRVVDKRYVAIVEGTPTWQSLVVDARLARVDDPEVDIERRPGKKAPLAIQTVSDDGDRALTRLSVLARGDGVSLVLARPETGRMHQIRCHLAHVSFPIVGDVLYGARIPFVADQELALHAAGVCFPRPEGGREVAIAPLPASWWAYAKLKGLDVSPVKDAMAELLRAAQAPGRVARDVAPRATPPKRSVGARGSAPAGGARSGPSRRGGRPGR